MQHTGESATRSSTGGPAAAPGAPDPSPAPGAPPPAVVVQTARVAGVPRVWGGPLHLASGALTALSLLLAALFLPVAMGTFWVLSETFALLITGDSWNGSGRAAFAGGTLTSVGIVYLLGDRIALLGNGRARRVLWEKAGHLLPPPFPETRFFVEVRTAGLAAGRREPPGDIGWLFVDRDELRFVGDATQIRVPRAAATRLGGGNGRGPLGGALGGPWLSLELVPSPDRRGRARPRHLRFFSREGERLSDTARATPALERALRDWLRPTTAGDEPPG